MLTPSVTDMRAIFNEACGSGEPSSIPKDYMAVKTNQRCRFVRLSSAAASSENDQGSANLASNTASSSRRTRRGSPHPADHRMLDPT